MGGEAMVTAVAREERHASTFERADTNRCSGLTKRCVDIDIDGIVDEVVEARSAEHPDLGAVLGSQGVERDPHAQLVDFGVELDELEPVLVDVLDVPAEESDDFVDEDSFAGLVDESEPELLDESELELLDESEVEPGGVLAFDPRLSVLKKPDPLKVTPTGWKTFFTASTSPESGWAYSVSESSVNACWTSMVSPVSTNL